MTTAVQERMGGPVWGPRDLEILLGVDREERVRDTSNRTGFSLGFISKRLRTLAGEGLLWRRKKRYALTRRGKQVATTVIVGGEPGVDVPLCRGHGFRWLVRCRYPNQTRVCTGFNHTIQKIEVNGWWKRVARVEGRTMQVTIQLNPGNVVIHPSTTLGSVAECARRAIQALRETLAILKRIGLVFTDRPRLEQRPEFAWLGHPLALAQTWTASQVLWQRGPLRIWVDRSMGSWELECNDLALATRIQATRWTGSVDAFMADLLGALG